jgi:hypothetical protein
MQLRRHSGMYKRYRGLRSILRMASVVTMNGFRLGRVEPGHAALPQPGHRQVVDGSQERRARPGVPWRFPC